VSPLARYVLFQVPGAALVAVGLAILWRTDALSVEAAGGLLGLWVAKDAALYPLVRGAYEGGRAAGGMRFVGMTAKVREPLDPEGWVVVRGERWRARLVRGARPCGAGATVRVRGAEGMTLLVEGPGRLDGGGASGA